MDSSQFREFAIEVIDYIISYNNTITERPVLPSVEPGYIHSLLPSEAPQTGEPWQDILRDVEHVIMPGMTHWQSPNFYAYFPASYSFPAVVAELLSAGLGVVGLNWITGPACTELEVAMMDWLGKLLGLPDMFLNCSEGPGGGVIQGTASEAAFTCLIAAKDKLIKELTADNPNLLKEQIISKLVIYSSDQSNSSIEKAGMIGSMVIRLLPSDKHGRLSPDVLEDAILKDLNDGFYPCYVVATLGTTGTCAFDNLEDLGPICNKYNIWLHIDAAYAGSVFSCPEYRYLMKGVEFADSFNFNPHKWMLINFDCSALWVKNAKYLVAALTVERIYLKHEYQGTAPEYLHWQIPLGRRMRALKIWFVLRSYGVEGIQKHIRYQISLAKYFESLVSRDERFEVFSCSMALVCFRLKGDNCLTRLLLDKISARKNIYMIVCTFKDRLVLRFSINSLLSKESDIDVAWKEISTQANDILLITKDNIQNTIENLIERIDGPIINDKDI